MYAMTSGAPASMRCTRDAGTTITWPATLYEVGTYTVALTSTNAYGSDTETKTNYITVKEAGAWTVITYEEYHPYGTTAWWA